MTKDVNETVKGKPDLERSAAAKARKSPPNPWKRIAELEAVLEKATVNYARTIGERDRTIESQSARLAAQSNTLAELAGVAQRLRVANADLDTRTNYQRRLIEALSNADAEASKPWWKRDGRLLAMYRRNVDAARANLFHFEEKLASLSRNPAGQITGLANSPGDVGVGAASPLNQQAQNRRA